MATINISLPDKLKEDAEALIDEGHFVSFSDMVRTALRRIVSETKYERLAREAVEEYKAGKGKLVENKTELEEFLHSI